MCYHIMRSQQIGTEVYNGVNSFLLVYDSKWIYTKNL
jgi:hypothetical protein